TSGRIVIEARNVAKAMGGVTLFESFSTIVQRGDRLGIIGPNGAGKTTLLRVLLGELPPDRGEVRLGTNLEVAYFDQRRQQLDPDATPWQTLCPEGGDTVMVRGRPKHVVAYLRDFLFRDEQAHGPVKGLSGGERNRLLLARILARPSNLLVLDEPTNDLDMDTLDLLEEVLADYAGTLLLVSHDRDFLDRLVTSVVAFEGRGRLREYAGGYSDYLIQRRPEAPPPPPPKMLPKSPKPAKPRPGLETRLQRELDRLPAKIAALEEEVRATERELSDPDLYRRDPDRFRATTERLDAERAELAAAEERWLELEMLREEAGAQDV
ncbi:MAG TPA: ATP-binding cassette domain-containing protein, partial [Geminicoccaceae bacterium]|nr:ATP-binding cassette domain-containing protein [Geminicoccaceae bacterium]